MLLQSGDPLGNLLLLRLQNIFLVCVLIVLAIEMVETVVKTIINREK